MSLYTSYQTSLALKEAGAPQQGDERAWYVSAERGGEPRLINATGARDEVRAWRLDNILEELHGHLWQISQQDNLDYVCGAYAPDFHGEWTVAASPPALPYGPVEAAAACWLAVLRAGKGAK